jgi:hypothetical protein
MAAWTSGEDSLPGFVVGLGFAPCSSRSLTIRAMGQQHSSLLQIGCGPRQWRRVGVIARVRIRALLQQLLQRRRIGVENRVHERRRAIRPASIQQRGILLHRFQECLAVAVAQRVDERDGSGIGRRHFGFVGQRIRPLGALLDPSSDETDVLRSQRTGRGHLYAELAAD